jgi:membrane-associated phospholipid phosphatase
MSTSTGTRASPASAEAAPRRRHVLWALVAACLAAFFVLALGYEHEPLASVDADVAQWMATDVPPWVEWLARPFSWLGGWIGLTALGTAAGILLARERAWLDIGLFLAAFVGTQLLVSLLKAFFDRARPDLGSVVPLPESAAFPSGHAAAGAASFGALAVLIAERLPRPLRTEFWLAVVALGVCIGLSRIVLNVHFVTDVVAGWCLGLAWLAACLLARDAISQRRRSDLVAQSHKV